MPPAAWEASTTGMIVEVSARLPSKAPYLEGEPSAVGQQTHDDLGSAPARLASHPPS